MIDLRLNAKYEILHEEAHGNHGKVFLRVKHVELVVIAVEPSGAGLAVCVDEAVGGGHDAEDRMHGAVNVRSVIPLVALTEGQHVLV